MPRTRPLRSSQSTPLRGPTSSSAHFRLGTGSDTTCNTPLRTRSNAFNWAPLGIIIIYSLDAQGFRGPPVAAEDTKEVAEDDSEEDLEDDSMESDDHVPFGCSPEPVDSKDYDSWDDPASD